VISAWICERWGDRFASWMSVVTLDYYSVMRELHCMDIGVTFGSLRA
jgi:hypothetical protein